MLSPYDILFPFSFYLHPPNLQYRLLEKYRHNDKFRSHGLKELAGILLLQDHIDFQDHHIANNRFFIQSTQFAFDKTLLGPDHVEDYINYLFVELSPTAKELQIFRNRLLRLDDLAQTEPSDLSQSNHH